MLKKGVTSLLTIFPKKRNPKELVREIEQQGGTASIIQGDVSKEEDVRAFVQFAHETYGSLDIYENTAGIENEMPSENLSLEDWNKVLNTNLTGTFLGLFVKPPSIC